MTRTSQGQGRPAKATAVEADDAAEGVSRRDVRSEPGRLSRGVDRGARDATTPVLPVPLTGPAYFVSHGGEEFPQLIIVLQGYGATVHLVGTTFINKKTNVTSSTFKAIPDVPVGTFELTLPQGKYSALAANGNLCTAKKLAMPTSFVGQNGARSTPRPRSRRRAAPRSPSRRPSTPLTSPRRKDRANNEPGRICTAPIQIVCAGAIVGCLTDQSIYPRVTILSGEGGL